MSSSDVPGAGSGDHVRGSGPAATLYMDLGCPRCAVIWASVRDLPLELCVRHFPVTSLRPRSPALHAACEAAAAQRDDAFWVLWDGLLADPSRTDDPHLWALAERAGLDLGRFDRDRRSEAIADRVRAHFRSGVRAGVTGTPAAFVAGEGPLDEPAAALVAHAGTGHAGHG